MTFAWTVENIERMKAMVADKKSASLIADAIGTTRNAVLGKCFRLKMSVHRPAKEKTAKGIVRRTRVRKRVMRFRPSLEPFVPEAALIVPLHKTLVECRQGEDCMFPYGDNPFTFCGHIATFGSSYCAAHHRVAYRPIKERRQ